MATMTTTLQAPVRFTPEIEIMQPDEQQTSHDLNETFDTILQRTSADYGHAVRAVHAKSHGLIAGRMTIAAGLPPELAQGLFATPGEHGVFLRMSTNAGDILPDVIGLPRGLAIKVLDVNGERLADAEGRTQDFILVNGAVFQAKTADKFLGNLKLLAKTTDRLEGTKKALAGVLRGVNTALHAVGLESSTVNALGGAPNVDPLGETYFSVTPFRYGDYVAKFSLVPVSPQLVQRSGTIIDAADKPNAIRETVQAEMRATDAVWELRVQLCRDLEKQPIEDSTVKWQETDSPFQTVATIHALPQDSWSEEKVQKVDEAMRFSVWTGLLAHQPLGNINRARKATYAHSANFRAQFNRCPIHEPTSNA